MICEGEYLIGVILGLAFATVVVVAVCVHDIVVDKTAKKTDR